MLNQIFPIIYHSKSYMVDVSCLCNASNKFKKMIESYTNQNIDIKTLRLTIAYEKFSPRNIHNFLRICQNLYADTQDSEVIEICEIALMFQAEKIYKMSIDFIHDNIDNNFSIPDDKYQTQEYLKIELNEPTMIHHVEDLDELEFDDTTDCTQTEDTNNDSKQNNLNTILSQIKKNKSVFYQIKIENTFMKCRRFYFYSGDKLLFSAKQKIHQVFISEGNEIHINDKNTKKIAIITQNSDGYNILNFDDQVIRINYVRTTPSQFKKIFSLHLSFMHYDDLVHWSPRVIRNPERLCGNYNRKPIKSKKNIILQNKSRHTTFIVRKMDKLIYEAECNSTILPIIAFSLAISEIIGPFLV